MSDSLKLSNEIFTETKPITPCPCGLKKVEQFTNLEDNKIYATPEDLINDTVIPVPTPSPTTSPTTTPVAPSIPSIEKFNMLNSISEKFTDKSCKKPKYAVSKIFKFILIVVFISLIILLAMMFFKNDYNNTPEFINDNIIIVYEADMF
jgi:hypothetical protein